MYRQLAIAFLLFFSTMAIAQNHQEQILNFNSYIIVNKDASLDITENIKVYANQYKIRHGLVRWLPTNYIDSYGIRHHTLYQLKRILINNRTSPYHTKNQNNQLIIYIGDRDESLAPGEYTYTIQYQVKDGVNFLKNQDELYWNITGNGWDFPIQQVTATITLPPEAVISTYTAFTGRLGAQEKLYAVERPSPNQIQFTTSQALNRGQGLTVAVGWPKGVMLKPTFFQKIKKHPDQTFSIEITVILILYFLLIWILYGKRPRKGQVIPLFAPPLNLSPAVMRYNYRMKYDIKCFTAAIVSMATKGFLKISNDNENVQLTKKNNIEDLTEEEKVTAEKLFPDDTQAVVELNKTYAKIPAEASKALKKFLSKKYKNVYFMNNTLYLIPGWILGAISFFLIFYSAKSNDETFAALMSIFFWTVFTFITTMHWLRTIELARITHKFRHLLGAALLTILVIALLGGGTHLFLESYQSLPLITLSLFMVTLIINIGFIYLMRMPTPAGQKLMDEISGFKMFLRTTERYRLEQFHPPERTPELFEKFLPYAIALDVENEWGQQFSGILEQTTTTEQGTYQPNWYSGTTWPARNLAAFATGLNGAVTSSLLSAMETSSSASGGGGGSSGGGGGGGGGGGW